MAEALNGIALPTSTIPFDPVSAFMGSGSGLLGDFLSSPEISSATAFQDVSPIMSSPFIVRSDPGGAASVVSRVAPFLIGGLAVWALSKAALG